MFDEVRGAVLGFGLVTRTYADPDADTDAGRRRHLGRHHCQTVFQSGELLFHVSQDERERSDAGGRPKAISVDDLPSSVFRFETTGLGWISHEGFIDFGGIGNAALPFASSLKRGYVWALAIVLAHLTATAQTPVQFVGGTGDWSDNTTWSPQIVPTSVEDVSITNAGTLRLDTSPLINGLTLGNSSATISADTAQTLFLSGPFTWSAGTLGNNVTVEAQSGSKTGNGTMQNAVLKLTGSWTHSAGFTSGGTFVNPLISIETNAVYDITFDGTVTSGDNTDAITNLAGGTFRKSAGTSTSIVDWRFDNRGTVDVHTGTISLREGGNYGGTTMVSNGAVLLLDAGTFTLANGGTASGAGTFQVETVADTPGGGTFTSSADLQLNSGGTLGGNGTLELNDPFLVTGGTINDSVTVNVNSGGIIGANVSAQSTMKLNLNAGTLIHTNGLITGGTFNDPAWTVKSGAVLDLQSDGTTFSGDNSDHLTNHAGGIVRKSTGTGTTVIDWFFANEGQVDVQTGALELNDSGTIGGTISVSNNSTLLYDAGSFTLVDGASINGAGTTRVETVVDVANGATYTADSDLHLNTGGLLGGSGILNVNETFLITSGAMNDSLTVNLNAGGIIGGSVAAQSTMKLNLNAGTLVHTNGLISGGTFNSPAWTVKSNAMLEFRSDGTTFSGDNSDHLTNHTGGIVRKSTGTGTTVIDWFFANEGQVDVQTELNDSPSADGVRSTVPDDVANGGTYTADSDLHLNKSTGSRAMNDATVNAGGIIDAKFFNANERLDQGTVKSNAVLEFRSDGTTFSDVQVDRHGHHGHRLVLCQRGTGRRADRHT